MGDQLIYLRFVVREGVVHDGATCRVRQDEDDAQNLVAE